MLVFRTPFTQINNWAVSSQQRARRNAMVQLTALAAVRAQRDEVRDFLEARLAPAPPQDPPVAQHG